VLVVARSPETTGRINNIALIMLFFNYILHNSGDTILNYDVSHPENSGLTLELSSYILLYSFHGTNSAVRCSALLGSFTRTPIEASLTDELLFL